MVWFYPCFSDLSVKDTSYLLLRELFHHKHWRMQGDDDSHCLILIPFFLWCCILPQEHSLVLPTRIPRSWPTLPPPLGGTCQPSISASYPSSLLPPLSPSSTICTKSPLAKGFPYPVTWVSYPWLSVCSLAVQPFPTQGGYSLLVPLLVQNASQIPFKDWKVYFGLQPDRIHPVMVGKAWLWEFDDFLPNGLLTPSSTMKARRQVGSS